MEIVRVTTENLSEFNTTYLIRIGDLICIEDSQIICILTPNKCGIQIWGVKNGMTWGPSYARASDPQAIYPKDFTKFKKFDQKNSFVFLKHEDRPGIPFYIKDSVWDNLSKNN